MMGRLLDVGDAGSDRLVIVLHLGLLEGRERRLNGGRFLIVNQLGALPHAFLSGREDRVGFGPCIDQLAGL